MANIKIPESVIPGIKAIGLLNDKELNFLYDVLRTSPKGIQIPEFIESLCEFLTEETSELVSRAIYSFGYLLVKNENADGTLSEKLKNSFIKQTKDDESPDLGEEVGKRLHEILLLCSFLIATFEAQRILWDHNKIIKSTDISTEVVLLNDKAYSIPATGLIMNKITLDIVNSSKDKNSEKSFVLDTEDLIRLKSQIESALLETEDIKKKYSSFVNFIKL